MLASLVLMSSYKTVLKEHTRQCLGFNVRCCTVVESYIVFYTNIELLGRSLFMSRWWWEKNRGAKTLLN